MESLSDLLKNLPKGPFVEQAEIKKRQILNDPLIQKLKSKHPELDDAILEKHLNRLYQYLTEYKSCVKCQGLEVCPNDFQGHYTRLSVETIGGSIQLFDHKVSCKKLLAKQSQEAIRKRIHSFYIDETALSQGYDFGEIVDIDKDRVKSVKEIMNYIILTKENGLQPKGLYLTGGFGTGKTFLMSYMLHELAKIGLSGVIVYMPEFIEDLKAMFSEPMKLKETIDLMRESDLLIFDDIGAENLNPWVRDHVMGSILNYRMNRKPTFYTSNYDLGALEKHFSFTNKDGEEEYKGQRIMDRIRPFVNVIEVKGSNKRGL